MRRALSGLIAFALLAAPLAAQRGAKQDSVKPAPKTAAKTDTAKPAAKVPPKADQKTDQSKQGAKVQTKSDQTKQPAAAPAAPPAAKVDAGPGANVSQSGGKTQLSIMREVYAYEAGGRRDPMVSLANTATLRPLLTEIECIGILYDEDGRNSEAIMRSLDKKKTYRVKVGQMLGRMVVAQITRREVVFTVDEYGFSRQVSMPVKPDTSIKGTP